MSCSTDCRWCKAERGEFEPSLVGPAPLPEAPAYKPLPFVKHEAKLLVSPRGRIFINYREVAAPVKNIWLGTDAPFSKAERLAWLDEEFHGIDPDALAEDDEGEIEVDPYWLLQDTRTVTELHRFDEGSRLIVDGDGNARGANPFSTDEGAAEWLGRVRAELRDEYRRASSDRERSAIQAREAALRARHNARCWARAVARYYEVDENLAAKMLDGWQKDNPIGWIGLEQAMRSMFEGCERDFFEARERWDAEFRASWSDEAKDEWLARMPEPPQHPTALVSSVKKIRRARPEGSAALGAKINTRTAPRGRRSVPRATGALRQAVAEQRAQGEARPLTPGNRRFYARVSESEQYAARVEWERAEMVESVRLDVPETLDFSGPGELNDLPEFVPAALPPLHRCGSSCLVCSRLAA